MATLIRHTTTITGLLGVLLIRCYVSLTAPRQRDERGDVPGWVLVTIMSAGLVMGIWTLAEGQLQQMLRAALSKVK